MYVKIDLDPAMAGKLPHPTMGQLHHHRMGQPQEQYMFPIKQATPYKCEAEHLKYRLLMKECKANNSYNATIAN
jgi:hypothetical protein